MDLSEVDEKIEFEKKEFKEDPKFLKNINISFFEILDPDFDKSLYIEASQYINYLINGQDFIQIIKYFEKYINENPPKAYPIEIGDLVNIYQNGIEYRYPLEKGATIIEYQDKSYQINFNDGRIFYLLSDGTYFETFENESEIYYVNPSKKFFRRWFGSLLFSKYENLITLQIGNNSLSFSIDKNVSNGDLNNKENSTQNNINNINNTNNINKSNDLGKDTKNSDEKKTKFKIKYSILNKFNLYIDIEKDFIEIPDFFNYKFDTPIFDFNNINNIKKIGYENLKGFSYYKDFVSENIVFNFDSYSILLQKNLTKIIFSNKVGNQKVLSIYLPEGIKLTDFDKEYSVSKINFNNKFSKKSIGFFDFYYDSQIEGLVNRIDEKVLEDILKLIRENLGWKIDKSINVFIPKDLIQYQTLLCGSTYQDFVSLPDGYLRDDLIISWPLNFPRYEEDKDMSYFFDKEFYTILLFQVVKKIMKQQVNFYGRIPFFIENGIPFYIASLYDEGLKNSAESLFNQFKNNVFKKEFILNNGALLVLTNPYITPMPQTKLLTIFSYQLLKYIISIYGIEKINSFLQNFKIKIEKKSFEFFANSNLFYKYFEDKIVSTFGVYFSKLIKGFYTLRLK